MINKIIKDRIDDGQLDECPLTLAELKKIVGKFPRKNPDYLQIFLELLDLDLIITL